jgi:hypothetical protein
LRADPFAETFVPKTEIAKEIVGNRAFAAAVVAAWA